MKKRKDSYEIELIFANKQVIKLNKEGKLDEVLEYVGILRRNVKVLKCRANIPLFPLHHVIVRPLTFFSK